MKRDVQVGKPPAKASPSGLTSGPRSWTLPSPDPDAVKRFFAFARERYDIMLRKNNNEPPPWTHDPILQEFRFCNVFREDDKVTKWFRVNVREPLGHRDADQVRAAVVFRFLNRIETGVKVKSLLVDEGAWDLEEFGLRLKAIVREGKPILGAAYMIVTPIRMKKVEGLLRILRPIEGQYEWLAREMSAKKSIEWAVELLMKFPYLGGFMSYEMATDLRHTPVLAEATDKMTWAHAGPGAVKGLGRIFRGIGKKGTSKGNVPLMVEGMRAILAESAKVELWPTKWPRWEMREVEHTLCEFEKYERTRSGYGRPKQNYRA